MRKQEKDKKKTEVVLKNSARFAALSSRRVCRSLEDVRNKERGPGGWFLLLISCLLTLVPRVPAKPAADRAAVTHVLGGVSLLLR